MPAVQFSNRENLRIRPSYEPKHYSVMNGKNTSACAYAGALHRSSQICLRLFLLDLHGTYCVHFQTIELNEILQSVTRTCLPATWRIVMLDYFDRMQIRKTS